MFKSSKKGREGRKEKDDQARRGRRSSWLGERRESAKRYKRRKKNVSNIGHKGKGTLSTKRGVRWGLEKSPKDFEGKRVIRAPLSYWGKKRVCFFKDGVVKGKKTVREPGAMGCRQEEGEGA